jgi:hypothetical protein
MLEPADYEAAKARRAAKVMAQAAVRRGWDHINQAQELADAGRFAVAARALQMAANEWARADIEPLVVRAPSKAKRPNR